MFPANFDRYIEVFGGGGWVLFGKPPDERCMEIYNDYNSNLANLFYCVKNRTGAFLKELGFLECVQLVLSGEIEHYLSLGCDHGKLKD